MQSETRTKKSNFNQALRDIGMFFEENKNNKINLCVLLQKVGERFKTSWTMKNHLKARVVIL